MQTIRILLNSEEKYSISTLDNSENCNYRRLKNPSFFHAGDNKSIFCKAPDEQTDGDHKLPVQNNHLTDPRDELIKPETRLTEILILNIKVCQEMDLSRSISLQTIDKSLLSDPKPTKKETKMALSTRKMTLSGAKSIQTGTKLTHSGTKLILTGPKQTLSGAKFTLTRPKLTLSDTKPELSGQKSKEQSRKSGYQHVKQPRQTGVYELINIRRGKIGQNPGMPIGSR